MNYVKNIKEFIHLYRNITNWKEYQHHRSEREGRKFNFITRPNRLRFSVEGHGYYVFKEIFVEDFYDIRKVLKQVPSEPIVIDIGANVGLFGILMLSKLPGAHIYAYEPFSDNVALMKNTLNSNPSYSKNFHIIQKAVTDKEDEEVNIYVNSSDRQSPIASIYQEFDERNNTTISVLSTSLQSIVQENNIDHIDILKMDCEGAEYSILYSTSDEILKKIKLALIEVHEIDHQERNHSSLASFLSAKGFAIKSKETDNGCYYLMASRG